MGNLNNRQTQSTANGIGCARLLIGSIGGLALLITLAALIGHGANDASACLRLTDPFLNVGMIDLHSGVTIGLSVPPLSQSQQSQWDFSDSVKNSPDDRFTAYKDHFAYNLYMRSAMTTNSYQKGRELGAMLYDRLVSVYVWSPDSQWLAYMPDTMRKFSTIAVSAAYSDITVRYVVKIATDETITFYNWSADSKYLALGTVESDGVTYHLYVWSLPTLHLVALRTYARAPVLPSKYSPAFLYGQDLVQWSPRGHILSYLTQNAAMPAIVLMPLDSPDIAYALPANDFTSYTIIPPMFTWSPDSLHVTVAGTGKQGFHVDLVSVDGSLPVALSDAVAKHPELFGPDDDLPILYWLADGQSLFYMNNSTDGNGMSGDLLAYRLKTKHTDVLATKVFNDIQQTPDHDYAFITWAQGNQFYIGVVRTADGKLLDAQARRNFPVNEQLQDMQISWMVKDKWLLLNPWEGLLIDPETWLRTGLPIDPETWLLNVETGERRPVKVWGTTSPDGTLAARVSTIPGSLGGVTLDKLHIENVGMVGARDIPLNPDEIDPDSDHPSLIWSSDSKYVVVIHDNLLGGGNSIQIVTLATGAIAEYHISGFYPDKYNFTTCH